MLLENVGKFAQWWRLLGNSEGFARLQLVPVDMLLVFLFLRLVGDSIGERFHVE
jgi:hypothetical protein